VFAGGFAPLIATALLAAGGGEPTLVAIYVAVMALITIVATFARETFRDEISEPDRAEREIVYTGRRLEVPGAEREPTGGRR
jgi:hypothetical protein